ncbi:DUF6415 family natural product biosynthesis protein [Streptomyces scabiei]|uniref:DUF6415 family natural product biosynthesis protein n=1 Tax=Streptomyces scabiei TaxID=1930 RepID=UPI0039EF2BA5
MPQRRTPEDRARRLALADQAADIWPAHPNDTTATPLPPIDVPTMRASARRLLVEGEPRPDAEELETLTLMLRGHIMVAIPEVEAAASKLAEDDIPRACALACIGEARMRLSSEVGPSPRAEFADVQLLARSVNALCDHYENLGHGA